jgi:hypothetical protein
MRNARRRKKKWEKRRMLAYRSRLRKMASLPAHIRSCLGKRRFICEETARQQAQKAGREIRESMECYHCVECGYWHIGHSESQAHRVEMAKGETDGRSC